MKNMQKHHADIEKIHGGEAEADDPRRPIQLMKIGLEEEESSCIVTCVE
jgi:hypothetical protein